MFQRAAVVELSQLAEVLSPPCRLGPYQLTSRLARSETSLIFTAIGGVFGSDEGVLKLTNSHNAARLTHELELLLRCADAGVPGVVRPLARELDWLAVPGLLDAHVAALSLPFLSGGNLLNVQHVRAGERAGLAIEVAHTLGTTLRHLLELDQPLAHAHLSARCVLLPRPAAPLTELTVIDFAAARTLTDCSSSEIDQLCRADVAAFGGILHDVLADARATSRLRGLIADCRAARYANMADPRLWQALQRAQRAERAPLDDAPWYTRLRRLAW